MNMLKTTIFVSALAGLAGQASAQAINEVGRAEAYQISAAADDDRAPVRTGTDGIARLKMTDEEHTNEQAAVKFSPDGRRALYVHMRTSKVNIGTGREAPPVERVQCALSALELKVNAEGRLAVGRPATAQYDIWATSNNGQEYR